MITPRDKKPLNIMVIAGTADARELIKRLLDEKMNVIATVATEFGSSLLESYEGLEVHQGRMTADMMKEFMYLNKIDCVIDASHPFAKDVSQNAMEAAAGSGAQYARFERSKTNRVEASILRVQDFISAAKLAAGFEGNIFLTTGSNHLEVFLKEVADFKERIYVRVLPDSNVLQKCEALGLTAKNIIAMKGPFSYDLNVSMLRQYDVAVMVTKESGDVGGTMEKLKAANDLYIPVILVERPIVEYINMFGEMEEVMEYVRSL